MRRLLGLFCVLLLCGISEVAAQQLIYRPVNTMFGGDTFNYQFLLQSAQAQNSFTNPRTQRDPFAELSELEQFTENLNRQLLSDISRSLFTQQVGENGVLSPGTFTFGSLIVEVFESVDGLVIDILDTTNGDITQIIIPGS